MHNIIYQKSNNIHVMIEPFFLFQVVYHKSDVQFSKVFQHLKSANPNPVFTVPLNQSDSNHLKDDFVSYTK